MNLISIDPGTKNVAIAEWRNSKLVMVKYIVVRKDIHKIQDYAKDLAAQVDLAVSTAYLDHLTIELPQVYQGAKQKGRPSDLIDLAVVVGALIQVLGLETKVYLPSEWKGQTPKPDKVTDPYIIDAKVRMRLDAEELKVYEAGMPSASYRHNVADAVGIGLTFLNRMNLR
jgi:hypothetical protein